MARFRIYSGDVEIGRSELEYGDPPMGVAFGRFLPNGNYGHIRGRVVASTNANQDALFLSVRDHDGSLLKSSGGVQIGDAGPSVEPEDIEVSVFGITDPHYESLFPDHVAAYERSFRNS